MTAIEDNRGYRKIINSWCMYDWANSAFATTIMAAMFPPFYRSMATTAGLSEANATAAWAYTTSIALLVIAILAPVLGAISDHTGGKKWYVAFFAGLGVIGTRGKHVNVLQHLMGYLKNHLSCEDNAYLRYVGAPGPH